jgi:predicted amidophosphoribosyltransferase
MKELKDWEVEIMEAVLMGRGDHGKCDCCSRDSILIECSSRRMDVDNNYNLCSYCAADHHEYWDEMWAAYYAGLLQHD